MSAGLSTAVLPKPIVLEGTDGDRLVRTVLLGEGTSLPTKSRFTFAIADAGGHVRLPIYQASRIIKELRAEVGPTPVGTPVEVEISCDEQVHIAVGFTVEGGEFGGSIEPPPPDDVPSDYDVDEIDRRFEEVTARLDEDDEEAVRLRAAYGEVRRDVDEARAAADHPKLIHRAADLEGLVREARMAEPLRPPLDEVEAAVASCLELLAEAEESDHSLVESGIADHLDAAREHARRAFRARDRQSYDEAVQAIMSAREFLAVAARMEIGDDQDLDVAVRAAMAVDRLRQMSQGLLIYALVGDRTEVLGELQGRLEELDGLSEAARFEPEEVLKRCQVLETEGRRLFERLSPDDEGGADLEGLLRLGSQPARVDLGLEAGGLFDRG